MAVRGLLSDTAIDTVNKRKDFGNCPVQILRYLRARFDLRKKGDQVRVVMHGNPVLLCKLKDPFRHEAGPTSHDARCCVLFRVVSERNGAAS